MVQEKPQQQAHPELIGYSPVYAPLAPATDATVDAPKPTPDRNWNTRGDLIFAAVAWTGVVAFGTWMIASSYFDAARVDRLEKTVDAHKAHSAALQGQTQQQAQTIQGARKALGCLPMEAP